MTVAELIADTEAQFEAARATEGVGALIEKDRLRELLQALTDSKRAAEAISNMMADPDISPEQRKQLDEAMWAVEAYADCLAQRP